MIKSYLFTKVAIPKLTQLLRCTVLAIFPLKHQTEIILCRKNRSQDPNAKEEGGNDVTKLPSLGTDGLL